MATLDQLEQALIKAHEAGNVEDARILATELKARTAQLSPAERATQKYLFGEPEGYEHQLPKYVREMSPQEREDAGFIGGAVNVAQQLGNLIGVVPDWQVKQHQEFMAPLHQTVEGRRGRFGGELAAVTPVGGGVGALAARVAPKLFPSVAGWSTAGGTRGIAAGIGRGGVEGGVEGAVLAGPGNRMQGGQEGGAFGALGGGILPLLQRGFIRPEPEAKMLMERGIDVTPGQMVPQSAYSQLEQQASSFGPTKAFFEKMRDRPKEQVSEMFINDAVPEGYGRLAEGDASAMLEEAYEAFRPEYDKLKNFSIGESETGVLRQTPVRSTKDVIASDIVGSSRFQGIAASPDTRSAVRGFLENQAGRLRNNMTTGDLIEIRSAIRDEARMARFGGSPDLDKARLLDQAEVALTRHINSNMPEELVEFNRALDRKYANYKIAEKAIFKAKNRDHPTFQQWTQAVQESTPYSEFARGGGQWRDLIKAAQRTFRTTDPATGQRIANMALLAGLTGAGYGATQAPWEVLAAAGIPAALLSGTPAGRRAAAGMGGTQRAAQQMAQQWPGRSEALGVMLRSMLPVYAAQQE